MARRPTEVLVAVCGEFYVDQCQYAQILDVSQGPKQLVFEHSVRLFVSLASISGKRVGGSTVVFLEGRVKDQRWKSLALFLTSS